VLRDAGAAILAIGLLAGAGCGGPERIPAAGEIAGHRIETTVDSPLARSYLEQGGGTPGDPEVEQALVRALEPLPGTLPEGDYFRQLSQSFSTDLATLQLIRILAGIPENAGLERTFRSHLRYVRAMEPPRADGLITCMAALDPPPIWFVPGWFYETQPGTGANFFRQRLLLDQLGVENELLPVIENGTVEENARIIGERVRARDEDEAIILVSASKGGPEVAHALGHVLSPEETRPVLAWINIGGLLRGSPLADLAASWPTRWIVPLYFRLEGLDPDDSVASLTTSESKARLAQQTIPPHVMLINFVGIPLSGHVSEAAAFGYGRMRALGPNDGLTPITDELAHGGRTIVQVGLDHYYRDPELDLKTVALALTVMTELGHDLPQVCRAGSRRDQGIKRRPS
jgi:hypothetical protein